VRLRDYIEQLISVTRKTSLVAQSILYFVLCSAHYCDYHDFCIDKCSW